MNTGHASRTITVSFFEGRYTVVATDLNTMGAIGANSAATVIEAIKSAQRQALRHDYHLHIRTDGSDEAQAVVAVCGDLIAKGARA